MSKPDLAAVAAHVCKQRNAALIRELGRGAFKRAFLVERGDGKFALKVAPITASVKPRFEREAAALAGCSHPAIAVLHESSAWTIDGQEYWVSIEEFLEGGTLADRQAVARLTHDQVREIGVALLDSLDHLRTRSLVHRDIKPANIMFRKGSEVVLTDFGIVRMLDAPTLTQDFAPQGPATPLYAAAEQLLNEKALIDWRTDQFCLALVLAECIVGNPPFAANRDFSLAVSRVAKREQLPADSADLLKKANFGPLLKALSPWPAQRYRLPKAFADALQKG